MPNLNCWGPGKSVDSRHPYCRGWEQKNKETYTLRVLSVQRVPGQLKISHFHSWGPEESNGAHIVRFCEKIEGYIFCTLFAHFPDLVCFYIRWACREGRSLMGLQGRVQGLLDSWYQCTQPPVYSTSVPKRGKRLHPLCARMPCIYLSKTFPKWLRYIDCDSLHLIYFPK